MRHRVSITRCNDYEYARILDAVRKSVDSLGGISRFAQPSERILIKPNILGGKSPEAGVTTHPSVVAALIELVRDAGATPVVGDSSALGNTERNASKAGILEATRALGAEFVELSTLVTVENPDGIKFKRLEVAREALEADGIINLPKLKTHAQMYLTLGVKNLFGCVPGKLKAQWHLSAGKDTDTFATMLLDLHNFLSPRLTVMDAVTAMEGNGPGNGDLRDLALIIAGANAVALDTVASEIVGARGKDVPVIRVAAAEKLPGHDPSDIEVVGVPVDEARVSDFNFPPLIDIDFASIFPHFLAGRVKKALTSRPHIEHDNCTLCSLCVELCPTDVMERKHRIVIDYDRCIRCYCCQESCPTGVISAREGWLKRLVPGL